MKSFFKSVIYFLCLPLVRFILALSFMVIPPIYAAAKGYTTLEPGFTYGVFYGFGLSVFYDAGFDLFIGQYKSKKESLGSK